MINRLSAPVHSKLNAALLLLSLTLPNALLAQQTGYTAPRTADGKPDLQGLWTNNTITPLERPERFAGKPTLTEEEQRAWEQQVADRTAEADLPSDPNRAAPTKGQIDLEDSYNSFWFDDGTTVAIYNGERRTSLVVDPPDGRIPAPTAAARARMEMAAEQRRLGPADGPESRSLAERCLLSFGSSGGAAHAASSLQQPLSDRAIPWLCHDSGGDGARCAYHPHRRRTAASHVSALAG
jgi:hypothetical protein